MTHLVELEELVGEHHPHDKLRCDAIEAACNGHRLTVLGWSLSATKRRSPHARRVQSRVYSSTSAAERHLSQRPGSRVPGMRFPGPAGHAWLRAEHDRPRAIPDYAHMDWFFHSMKSETVHGITFAHEVELAHVLPDRAPRSPFAAPRGRAR